MPPRCGEDGKLQRYAAQVRKDVASASGSIEARCGRRAQWSTCTDPCVAKLNGVRRPSHCMRRRRYKGP